MSFATCNAGPVSSDELVVFPFGLEATTANRLIKSGELRARKLGRKWYALRSDVLGLIMNAPKPRAVRTTGALVRDDLGRIAAREASK